MGKAVLQGWSAEYRTFTRAIISLSAVGMSLFHLYTGATIVFTSMVQRPIHLAFALGLIFLLFPSRRGRPPASPSIIDWGLATFGVAGCGYIVWNHMSMEPMRTVFPTVLDLAFGVITIALVIECARRTLGPALAIVATIMILYGLFGHLLPLPIGHSGLTWKRIVSLNYLLDLGIFGVPLGVSASFVFLFVLLAAFLDKLAPVPSSLTLPQPSWGGREEDPLKSRSSLAHSLRQLAEAVRRMWQPPVSSLFP